jgi:hypothetical protein
VKIGDVGSKLETIGNGITSVGKKVSVASAAVTALGTASVKTAADFESSMSQVQATMGITKDSMSDVNGESVNTISEDLFHTVMLPVAVRTRLLVPHTIRNPQPHHGRTQLKPF